MTHEERTKDFNDLHDQNLVNEAKTTESRKSIKIIDIVKALLLAILTGFIVLLIWCAIAMLLEREFLTTLYWLFSGIFQEETSQQRGQEPGCLQQGEGARGDVEEM